MKSFETMRPWLIIIGLLLFSGIASLVWIAAGDQIGIGALNLETVDLSGGSTVGEVETEPELITIQLDQYLLGEVLIETPGLSELHGRQVPPLVIAGILTALTVGGLLAVGIPLAVVYVMLDRQTGAVKEDPEFQEKQSAMENREKERLRELAETQPADPIPSHEMPRWAKVSTSLIILFFVILIGFALSETFYPSGEIQLNNRDVIHPALPLAGGLGLITLLILVSSFTRGPARTEGEAADGPQTEDAIPWATIWVVITGLIFIGIGTGIMLAIRSAGAG